MALSQAMPSVVALPLAEGNVVAVAAGASSATSLEPALPVVGTLVADERDELLPEELVDDEPDEADESPPPPPPQAARSVAASTAAASSLSLENRMTSLLLFIREVAPAGVMPVISGASITALTPSASRCEHRSTAFNPATKFDCRKLIARPD
ncbi:hypothetical protein [Paraburkholderia sp. Ac-20347]|uniref:hypothetical protein n=1 Tax=Paraburkholderia sp. Ac-20347 TaxID=2703892 RepID=UPI00197E3DA2|nr:hypothetical protein [Paraburkholderia sp. Ac-20347]MBN3813298.1 hypothetical protein [Paraburkholderia sp. Ac-20347]